MNVQHKLCEAMKETEGPKGGTGRTLQEGFGLLKVPGVGMNLQRALCPRDGQPSHPSRCAELMLAAELSVFFALRKVASTRTSPTSPLPTSVIGTL